MATNRGIMLDIGCGANKQPGWTGMDVRSLPGVDIVHDFEVYPWPIEDDSVLTALASHVVEHINPAKFGFINWMNEVWRVMVPGGQLAISMPYGYSPGFLQDPTHCNPCNEFTWFYFDPEPGEGRGSLWGIYEPKPWKIQSLYWDPMFNMEVLLRKRA